MLTAPPETRVLSLVAMTALLAAGCGGGGSGDAGNSPANLSLSLSPKSISVSATVAQSAPLASFQASIVGGQPGQKVYLTGKYSTNGIASVNDASGSQPISINIQFKSPSSLATGVYTDTVEISACSDQACTQQISNSPQQVQVQYTVNGTLVKLISLSPSTAVARGAAFNLAVNGSNFTQGSQVLWNNSLRTTTYVSPGELTAQITAADIAMAGSIPVSVNDAVNGASNSLPFTIQSGPLSLSSISPSNVTVGGTGFTLTVLGGGLHGQFYRELEWRLTPDHLRRRQRTADANCRGRYRGARYCVGDRARPQQQPGHDIAANADDIRRVHRCSGLSDEPRAYGRR